MQAVDVVYDRAAFLDRLDGDETLAREIEALFLAEMTDEIEALASASARRECGVLAAHAHAVKGAAANLGAIALQAVAAAMERLAREARLNETTALLADMRIAFARLRAAVAG